MKRKGFTLIELLIVIAIILILIAIALPNFLEAQIRAKVTKVKGNLRTIQIAMESYYLDFGMYPPDHDPDVNSLNSNGLYQLTSPIAYVSEVPDDPFNTTSGLIPAGGEAQFEMASTGVNPALAHIAPPRGGIHAFNCTSHGPDQNDNFGCNDQWPFCSRPNPCSAGDGWMTYAPTNGSRSTGEIVALGGQTRAGAYCIDGWNAVFGKYP